MLGITYEWLLFGHWAKPNVLYMYFCAGFSSLRVYFIIQNIQNLLQALFFLAWGSCFRRRHFTLNGQVGSQRANGIICRIVKEKTLQSESLVRIQTSCSQPREGNPSWVESFVRSSQCLFIFASRGEVQCRLPILRSYPLVPRQWYARIVFIFMLYGSCFFFYLIRALSC